MKIFALCTHDIITKWTQIYKKSQWRLFDEDIQYSDESEHDEDEPYDDEEDKVKKRIMDTPKGLPIVQKANGGMDSPFQKYWHHGIRANQRKCAALWWEIVPKTRDIPFELRWQSLFISHSIRPIYFWIHQDRVTDSKWIVPVKSKWDKSMSMRFPSAPQPIALPNWDTRWHSIDDASDLRRNARSNYGVFFLFLLSDIFSNNAKKSGFRIIWVSFSLTVIPMSLTCIGRVRLRWCQSWTLTVKDQMNEPQTNDRETGRKGEWK